MRILGLDYGTKQIGLAWADTTIDAVLPFGLIKQTVRQGQLMAVVSLLEKEKVDKLVIGFPLGLDGRENSNTERVKKFVFELQKFTSIPIEFFDERLSSRAADQLGGTVSRDEKAAMVILEGYLLKTNPHK